MKKLIIATIVTCATLVMCRARIDIVESAPPVHEIVIEPHHNFAYCGSGQVMCRGLRVVDTVCCPRSTRCPGDRCPPNRCCY